MRKLRRLLLFVCLACGLSPLAQATTPPGTGTDGMLVIVLEHHWVVEIAGHRFGLIQFDTPSTTLLLGGFDLDFPMRASAVLAPVAVVPALMAIGIIMHGRRRRHGFYSS